MEVLLQWLVELIVQVLGEVLVEAGLQSVAEPFRREPRPAVAVIGYTLFGLVLGAASLLLVHQHMMPDGPWRWINLMVTPVAAGFVMTQVGAWRQRRGQPVLRIDRFAYGYLFALAFAAVRFKYAG